MGRDHRVKSELKARIQAGKLASSGLLCEEDIERAVSLLGELKEKGIETVRVVFPDQHGIFRGKTIVADALPSLFCSGLSVPSTLLLKDTSGRTVFPVWSGDAGVADQPMGGAGDVLLVPDAETFRPIPWLPGSAWLLCHCVQKSGEAISFDPVTLLRTAVSGLAAAGYELCVGLEVEFHIFTLTGEGLEHGEATMPAKAPETRLLAPGYQLLSDGRYGEHESILEELRNNAQALGLAVRSMEVEMGPGQFEFTFEPASPQTHAHNMMMFRAMVKEVCARYDLHATFMCRPREANSAASGWHLHQSLINRKNGENCFIPETTETLTPLAGNWIGGLLQHAREACLLTTPSVTGYKRFQPYQLAPDRIQWGRDNRGAMIRALDYPGDGASRIENRIAETSANPYYYFASQIACGLHGIEEDISPPPPVEKPYDNASEMLPSSLGEAIDAFGKSKFFRTAFGDGFVDYLVRIKQAEWERYLSHVSDWEEAEYSRIF